MLSIEIFLLGLLIVSTLTGLTTEAIKMMLADRNKTYYSNILTAIIAIIISIAVGIIYIVLNGIGFNANSIISLIVLAFMSWLCAMVGYDKVMQAVSQFKLSKNGDGK